VRRREEDFGPGVRGKPAQLEPFLQRLGAVVTWRHNVRMAVDEAWPHARQASYSPRR